MPRSLKKGPFVDLHLAKKVQVGLRQERSQAHQDLVAPLDGGAGDGRARRSPCTTAASTSRCSSPRTWSATSSASSPRRAPSRRTPGDRKVEARRHLGRELRATHDASHLQTALRAHLAAEVPPGGRRGARPSRSATPSRTLKFMPKKGAELVRKVLESAVANAEHNHGADIDELKVSAHSRGRGSAAQALRGARQGARRAHHQAQQPHHRRRERRQEGLTHGSEGQSAGDTPRDHPRLDQPLVRRQEAVPAARAHRLPRARVPQGEAQGGLRQPHP